eukprot:gb/GECH01013101.1/.p1 GENE.gb/GECH01013101.1/~~gb/GECH01013101.1/.p1  ORF type:complete len:416 (+),score=91.82 gb/GECH01013101.1/:1-1248(+)
MVETATTANAATTSIARDDEETFNVTTQMLSGATAGTVADTLFHPFETVKTRLQAQPADNKRYHGVSHTVKTIRREEGIRGLYKGLTSTILGTCPDSATYFTVYEATKRMILPFASEHQAESGAYLAAGAIGEITSSALCVPFEVVGLRMQMSRGYGADSYAYRNVFHGMYSVYRKDGMSGLYRGLGATMLRDVPYSAVQFMIYELTKQFLLKHDIFKKSRHSRFSPLAEHDSGTEHCSKNANDIHYMTDATNYSSIEDQHSKFESNENSINHVSNINRNSSINDRKNSFDHDNDINTNNNMDNMNDNNRTISTNRVAAKTTQDGPMAVAMVSGAFAGGIAALATNPMDVAKTRLQTQKTRSYRNIFHAMQMIWRKEGVTGFFRGSLPRMALTASVVSVTFACLEEARIFFGRIF